MAIPFTYILKRHPALMVMIHFLDVDQFFLSVPKTLSFFAKIYPFLDEEKNPMQT